MTGQSLALITHQDCVRHEVPGGHPESAARLQAVLEKLANASFAEQIVTLQAEHAEKERLQSVHSASHIEHIFAAAPPSGLIAVDPDTSMGPHSLSAALYAAGAVLQAIDRVMRGEYQRAFCAVRPPGHHAEHNRAMGFCLFNNIAVGASYAMLHHQLKRVAIVDFDVHHGNGTQDIFTADSRVLFCSTHQHPFYPYTGADSSEDNIINVPLAAYAGSNEFKAAITEHCLPALEKHRPELIFVSAGFDAHRDDPLAAMNLTEEDYYWVTKQIVDVAKRHSKGRVISTLEGGYNLQALANSVVAHTAALLEEQWVAI